MPIESLRHFIRNNIDYHSCISAFSLDIGCGFSLESQTSDFKKYKLQTLGSISCDLVRSEIKLQNFVQCDGQKLPFKDGSFDVVFLMQVIEHVPHLHDLLQEINRILKQKGVLMLTTPNLYSINSYRDPNHLWHFTPRTLCFTLKNYFSAIKITGNYGPWILYNFSHSFSSPVLRSFMLNITKLFSIVFFRFPSISNNIGARCVKHL